MSLFTLWRKPEPLYVNPNASPWPKWKMYLVCLHDLAFGIRREFVYPAAGREIEVRSGVYVGAWAMQPALRDGKRVYRWMNP